ncbi:MAG TPA: hypothetical protein VEK79_08775 [Thermoanaerobaculia bacterium]|nr:hypothetical protein [Thermoanaerobaculia bacterium]
MRVSEVEAITEILHADFDSVEAMRERLRAIVAPDMPSIPLSGGRPAVPRLD